MSAELRPGEVLAGKYAIECVLGRGGMGVVLAARHLQLDERVAIKLMLPEVAANADAVARFVREARAAAKIRSEHVVRVSDVSSLEGGQPYMVMEHLEGSDLASLLHARGPLPLEEVAEYVLQACEAISEAHALGIVHRDLKPSNLYLTRRVDGTPVVKVLDFGISKVSMALGTLTAGTPSRTQTSALMGSPLYMSPEQMTSSRDVDARSDVWALGVIIYELLSGTPPFMGQTLPEVCARILEGRMPPLRPKVPGLPQEVEAVVARCIVRDLGARFRDVGELSRALGPFAPKRARVSLDRISAALGMTSTYARPSSADDPLAPPVANRATDATWAESRPPARPRTSRYVMGGLGLVGLAGVVALGALGRRIHSGAAAVSSLTPHDTALAARITTNPQPSNVASLPPPSGEPTPSAKVTSAHGSSSSAAASPQLDTPAPAASPLAAPPQAPRALPNLAVVKPASPEIHRVSAPKPGVPAVSATPASKPKPTLTLGGRL
jgi:serine/threonine protein kinase